MSRPRPNARSLAPVASFYPLPPGGVFFSLSLPLSPRLTSIIAKFAGRNFFGFPLQEFSPCSPGICAGNAGCCYAKRCQIFGEKEWSFDGGAKSMFAKGWGDIEILEGWTTSLDLGNRILTRHLSQFDALSYCRIHFFYYLGLFIFYCVRNESKVWVMFDLKKINLICTVQVLLFE